MVYRRQRPVVVVVAWGLYHAAVQQCLHRLRLRSRRVLSRTGTPSGSKSSWEYFLMYARAALRL